MGLKERRQREKEQRREQILDSARELILKHGIHEVSVQQIAKLAELSVGTIYLYFKSKEELFATLQEEILDFLYNNIRETLSGIQDPAERVRRIAMEYKRFSEEQKQYFDVINYFISPLDIFFPTNLKKEVDKHGNMILNVVVESIQMGVDQGIFDKVKPKRCALMLWGTVHGLIQFRKLKETILKEVSFDELYRYSVEFFINGLYRCDASIEERAAAPR